MHNFAWRPQNKHIFLANCNSPGWKSARTNTDCDILSCGYSELAVVMKTAAVGCCIKMLTAHRN